MADDLGEHLFGTYLAARGYEVLGRHVDLGTAKRPDFLVRAGDREVVVEIKTFDPSPIPPASRHSGFGARNLTPVRTHIGTGAKQLRAIPGRPLVVVLTSPTDPFVPLSPMEVMQAMYGDLSVRFGATGLEGYLGRNAKLHIAEPDGTSHGHHAHLSAVAVLRCAPAVERRAVVWLREHIHTYDNDLAAYTDALQHAERAGEPEEACYLDVFETVSETAVPLPRAIFNGPLDGRWGRTAPGKYGQLTTTDAPAKP